MGVVFCLVLPLNKIEYQEMAVVESIPDLPGNFDFVQVNLFQKLATSGEHVVYQNCSECQNKTKTTICVHNIFCRYSELTIFMNNEQFVVVLCVT
jgi:hypothetical protein